jgi:transcriptional regulator with AAA-type ATPase domain/tetratricopeptide (TPR) repeat protein
MAAIREKIGRLLERQSDSRRLPPILIQGETGTGKGLVARGIHRAGPRSNGQFVDVNCAAIPETLLEAELFGFERGAFTDARQAKAGLFQAAHRGTIFLDEVALLPDGLQAKLLKVIEERSVRRLGSTRTEPIDVWILAATNEDLADATRSGRFREDLYHRLAVLTLRLPPLRERGEDALLLADHFLARTCAEYGLPPTSLASDARAALMTYSWPGNIRELSNVIERVALLSEGTVVTAEMLGLPEVRPRELREAQRPAEAVLLGEAVGSVEQEHILEALRQTSWNISRAAARLGVSRNTLRYRIEKYGLRPGMTSRPSRPSAEAPAPPAAPEKAPVAPEVAAPGVVWWERRRLALLHVLVEPCRREPSPALSSRPHEVVLEKVRSFGGRVEEVSPAGVMAVFGLEQVEDAPRRAALAAMAIQKTMERDRGQDAEAFAPRAGIHVGQFLIGSVGGELQLGWDSKREAWSVLDELVARAEPGAILVSETATPFLDRRFDVARWGVSERTAARIYRVVGRERAGLAPGGRMARFVGRRHELELLRERLASIIRGRGQVVGIVGDPGIGKSRLLFEFRQSITDQPITYLEGHCFSYGTTTPYLPVLDVVRLACEALDADGPDVVAEKVRARLGELEMDPAEGAPYLLHLLGIEDGPDRLGALDPGAIKTRVFETLRQMSLRASRQKPLLIVVEDLHWIDQASEECFASLVEAIPGARILLVSTYRPGYRPPWIEKSYATQMALQPLPPHDSLTVVRSLLGSDDVAAPVVEMILDKAEGNPFFLEELARAVREQEGLSPAVAVPDTIQEVLFARIDRLPAEGKRLLECASAIGKDVPFSLLRATVDLQEDALRRALVRLQAAEFLYETSVSPEPEYTFKHALTHEVAYESLLPERRRALHARVVGAVEQLYPDRLTEQVDRLADHAFRAELWEKAVAYLRQAGARAAARSAHGEAVARFEQALVALKHLPERRETLEQAIDIRLELRTSLLTLGEFDRNFDHLGEAEKLARALDDQRRLGWVCGYVTDYFRQIGDYDGAIEFGQRALAIAAAVGDFALEVATNAYLGHVHHALGHYRRGAEFLRKNIESLVGDLGRERFGLPYLPSVHSRSWLVFCLAELGEFAEATTVGGEGRRLAESADDPFSLTSAHWALGNLYLRKGDLSRVIPLVERGLELSRAWNIRLLVPGLVATLGAAYTLTGRALEALPLLEEAIEQHAAMRRTAGQSPRLALLGQAYLLAGRAEEAARVAERALRLARDHKERGNEAWALRLLGEIADGSDPPEPDEAEARYRQSLALAAELEMRPLIAHCHLGLGRLSRRRGDRAGAAPHLSLAVDLFEAMEMPLWLDQGRAELGEVR